MSAERRLAKLEDALPPKAGTLLWLAEAHEFGSLDAYVGWLIEQPRSAAPLHRVPAQAEAATRAARRGEPHDIVARAVRDAVRDAGFLVELVLTLNRSAEETVRHESLRYAALAWELRARSAEAAHDANGMSGHRRGTSTRGWRKWRAAVASRVNDLNMAEAARVQLERRYLDGHASLFPDLAGDWQRLRDEAERFATLGDEVEGRPPRRRRAVPLSRFGLVTRLVPEGERAHDVTAYLADSARGTALDLLGNTDGTAAIAERRLLSRER